MSLLYFVFIYLGVHAHMCIICIYICVCVCICVHACLVFSRTHACLSPYYTESARFGVSCSECAYNDQVLSNKSQYKLSLFHEHLRIHTMSHSSKSNLFVNIMLIQCTYSCSKHSHTAQISVVTLQQYCCNVTTLICAVWI